MIVIFVKQTSINVLNKKTIMKKENFKNRFLAIILLFIATFSLIGCDDTEEGVNAQKSTITVLAQSQPNLSVLVSALVRAGLDDNLNAAGTFTVFAPTNTAFNTYLTANGFVTNGNPDINTVPIPALEQLLLNHVLGEVKDAAGLPSADYLKTLGKGGASTSNTLSMFVKKTTTGSTTTVTLNGVSNVTTANVLASNGVVHIVDAVIGLPTVVTHALANPNFSKLVAALTFNPADNFVATLSTASGAPTPFTVFAPVDSAFTSFFAELSPPPAAPATLAGIPAATLTKVLKYHVVTNTNALSSGLMDLQSIPTFQGTNVTVQKTTTSGVTTIKIKDTTPGRAACTVILADVQCSNGVIHALEKVLLPQ